MMTFGASYVILGLSFNPKIPGFGVQQSWDFGIENEFGPGIPGRSYVVGATATRCSTARCMNTAGCTTGRVNYANKPSLAVLGRSSQDAYGVIRLTCRMVAVWTVDHVSSLLEN